MEERSSQLAAARSNAAERRGLQEVVKAGLAVDLRDEVAWTKASFAFHGQVASMSGNRVLDLLGEGLRLIYHDRIENSVMPIRVRESVRCTHSSIADAILARDASEAERLMREHMADYAARTTKAYGVDLDRTVRW